eukprot:2895489-Prorocentrum_lima.AAC.1
MYAMTPRDQMSTWMPYHSFRRISGATYPASYSRQKNNIFPQHPSTLAALRSTWRATCCMGHRVVVEKHRKAEIRHLDALRPDQTRVE